ncbi:MAG: neutral/alkaline non-lysosomal ceramidase N-terminal domain-containing protein [Candidatus Sumerlaeia bacterium]
MTTDNQHGPNRRRFLQGAIGTLLAGALLGKPAGRASAGAPAAGPLGSEVPSTGALPYRIGAASVDITPTWRTMLAGFEHRTKPTTGVVQPIHARAFVIDDGTRKVVYVNADICYWESCNKPYRIIGPIREALGKKHGFKPDEILLVATHNHSGPVMGDERFRKLLVDRTIEVVGRAVAAERPARLFFGRGSCGIGVSRRGTDMNGDDLWEINPYGPRDPEVFVLKAVGADGRPFAVTFNYACHPTTIGTDEICGDYVGYAQSEMEKRLGGATALFLQGTAGDIKPDYHAPADRFNFIAPRLCTPDVPVRFGTTLADEVTKVLAAPMEEITGAIRVGRAAVELPVLTGWTGMNQIETDSKPDPARPFSGPTRRMARMARRMFDSMDEAGNYKLTQAAEASVVRIGDKFVNVGFAGEVCTPIGLRVKDQLRGKNVMVTAYTNVYIGYIPGQSQLAAGGYEVFNNYNSLPYSPEAEDVLVCAAMGLVKALDSGKQQQ